MLIRKMDGSKWESSVSEDKKEYGLVAEHAYCDFDMVDSHR